MATKKGGKTSAGVSDVVVWASEGAHIDLGLPWEERAPLDREYRGFDGILCEEVKVVLF